MVKSLATIGCFFIIPVVFSNIKVSSNTAFENKNIDKKLEEIQSKSSKKKSIESIINEHLAHFAEANFSLKAVPLNIDISKNIFFNKNESFTENYFKDSLSIFKKRKKLVAAIQLGTYTANLVSLAAFWYAGQAKTGFKFFNDNDEWLQVDKASHIYGAYIGGNLSMQMWKWAGWKKKNYVWIGGTTGLAYMTVIEVLDGFGEKWGFSTGDYIANMVGAAATISQELLWDEQRIHIKYGVHVAQYTDPGVDNYLNRIYGKSVTSRLVKDYNAQTYWVSFNLKSFFKKSTLPSWFAMAIGYGGQDMFGARWDGILDNNNQLVYPENHFKRYRQWYLAPDIDFTKIKTKNKFLKAAFIVLNCFKFPAPSIEFSQGSLRWNWIHF